MFRVVHVCCYEGTDENMIADTLRAKTDQSINPQISDSIVSIYFASRGQHGSQGEHRGSLYCTAFFPSYSNTESLVYARIAVQSSV